MPKMLVAGVFAVCAMLGVVGYCSPSANAQVADQVPAAQISPY